MSNLVLPIMLWKKISSVSQAFLSPLVRVRSREDVIYRELFYASLLILLGRGFGGRELVSRGGGGVLRIFLGDGPKIF